MLPFFWALECASASKHNWLLCLRAPRNSAFPLAETDFYSMRCAMLRFLKCAKPSKKSTDNYSCIWKGEACFSKYQKDLHPVLTHGKTDKIVTWTTKSTSACVSLYTLLFQPLLSSPAADLEQYSCGSELLAGRGGCEEGFLNKTAENSRTKSIISLYRMNQEVVRQFRMWVTEDYVERWAWFFIFLSKKKIKGRVSFAFLNFSAEKCPLEKHLLNQKATLIFRKVSIRYFGCALLYMPNVFIAIQNLQHHFHQQNQRSWNTLICEMTAIAHCSCRGWRFVQRLHIELQHTS